MKLLVLFIAIVAMFVCSASAADLTDLQYQGLFVKFVERYRKTYEMSNFFHRFGLFRENLKWITDHNNDKTQTFSVGVNQFADMTEEEWNKFKGLKLPEGFNMDNPTADPGSLPVNFDNMTAIDSINWNQKGYVTPVINQGACGSCYAWASAGALESAEAIAHGADTLKALSPQQVVDCSTQNNGCGGGWMQWVYSWVRKNGGICSAASYPYTGKQGVCKTGCTPVSNIVGYMDLSGRTDDFLAKAVTQQPVTIAVQSNSRGFMFYKNGIVSSQCGTKLDHAIFVVGYGTDAERKMDYYIVKNSWGSNWGENGFVRIQKKTGNTTDRKGMCGLLVTPVYPVVPKPVSPRR